MVCKRKELIRHSAFISCDLQVRAPTVQHRFNSECNGFCFRLLPNTACYYMYLLIKTSETLFLKLMYTEKVFNYSF